MRGPAWARFGTQCSQVFWQVPPMHQQVAGREVVATTDGPPPSGRSRNRRVAPSDRIATTVSAWRRPMRSPCHATESLPSR